MMMMMMIYAFCVKLSTTKISVRFSAFKVYHMKKSIIQSIQIHGMTLDVIMQIKIMLNNISCFSEILLSRPGHLLFHNYNWTAFFTTIIPVAPLFTDCICHNVHQKCMSIFTENGDMVRCQSVNCLRRE